MVNQPDSPSFKAMVMAIERGIENIKSFVTPLMVLRDRLTRSEFVKFQKIDCTEVYNRCLASDNFEHATEEKGKHISYRLVDGLLICSKGQDKIVVPESLIGVLLAHCHLYGHKGLPRMLANLESYHFKNKYTIVRRFISACYGCFLSQTPNRHIKLGTYPIPERPFQELMMDIAENINLIKGYQHLLIIQCVLTDFVIIIPLKTKKASEIEHMLSVTVFQQHNVERVLSDNGKGFRSLPHLAILSALHIQVVASASLSPIGRGKIERLVGIVKLMIKRILATKPTYNWSYIPLVCAIALNTTVSPRTGFKPSVMVGGNEGAGLTFMDIEGIAPPHYLVKNNRMQVEMLHKDLQESLKVARERLNEIKTLQHERLNKNKVTRDFEENDYVFVKDRAIIPGSSRPFKTKLQSTPYIVLSVRHTSSVVKRLSDGFTAMYSNNDLKRYDGGSQYFKDLPQEVQEVLINKFQDLLADDLTTIAKFDPLGVPDALPLQDLETGTPVSPGKDLDEKTEDERDLQDYAKALVKEDIEEELSNLKLSPHSDFTHSLYKQADLESDSEDENLEDSEEENWKDRLRPRKGKRVRFQS